MWTDLIALKEIEKVSITNRNGYSNSAQTFNF
jgi:hypothetical protein